ncbi:hypothetical protein D3C85_1454630 [compost metagenome]
MRLRNGQINDHLNLRIREQFLDRAAAHTKFLTLRLRTFNIQVRAGYNLKSVKAVPVFKVDPADIASSNNTCFNLLHFRQSLVPYPEF